MTFVDFLILLAAFLLGLLSAYFFFRLRIGVIEERAKNDLERWKLECTNNIRKDSVNRSRSTLKGRISEQMAPLLPEFPFSPADARFIGNPGEMGTPSRIIQIIAGNLEISAYNENYLNPVKNPT